MSTSSILQRVAQGDASAVQESIDEYGGLVWSLARRFTPTPSDAEDAVQEVFIALWQNAGRFDPERGAEVTFVATIARRRLIDRGRRHERRERVMDEVRREAMPEAEAPTAPLETREEAERAMRAMGQLSPDQRRVLDLAIHQGCTHEQIARITRMPLGTVKTHARRGLMRIRALLEERSSGAATEVQP